ncbi:MAG: ribonuclease P protein component 1 [Haloferacaceae archaeon]
MPLTPETLVRHELTGLHAAVASAPNPDLVGVAGRVIRETRNTLVLASAAATRQVPKRPTTFEFRLPAGGDGEPGERVRVDGGTLVSRPARRTENAPTPGGDDRWR